MEKNTDTMTLTGRERCESPRRGVVLPEVCHMVAMRHMRKSMRDLESGGEGGMYEKNSNSVPCEPYKR